MKVVSLKMNSNDYPLKNTNYHYLLLNTTIIKLCNSKISLIFCEGIHSISLAFRTCFKTRKPCNGANATLTTNVFTRLREKKYLCSEQLKQPFLFEG